MLPRISLILLLFVTTHAPALAQEPVSQLIEKWYSALASGDRQAFSDILSDNARIRLEDLEIEQNKQEFIESLDEWENAMRGSTITHRIEEMGQTSASVLVCYRFPDNELFGREAFRVANGQIVESAQSSISESCEVF
ncbi:MAG: nuclear transport factor 2 family protein [Phyllobacterium sp.]